MARWELQDVTEGAANSGFEGSSKRFFSNIGLKTSVRYGTVQVSPVLRVILAGDRAGTTECDRMYARRNLRRRTTGSFSGIRTLHRPWDAGLSLNQTQY